MKDPQKATIEPYPIGFCAGCGQEIKSNEAYYLDYDNMIHADGQICSIKHNNVVIGRWTCLLQYIQQNALEDEVARLLGMERRPRF